MKLPNRMNQQDRQALEDEGYNPDDYHNGIPSDIQCTINANGGGYNDDSSDDCESRIIELNGLSDVFEHLKWGKCKYVSCSESCSFDESEAECCLCEVTLKTSDSKNHMIIGSPLVNAWERLSKIYYLCRKCKRYCNICH